MREIKFRAWDKDDKKMIAWEDVILQKDKGDDFYLLGYEVNSVIINFDHAQILMQFTGLKDKNGVEIYEGDIIIPEYGDKFIIKFSEDRGGWFPFASDDGCGCCAEEVANHKTAEVIGNIYENPELLEVENDR